MPQSKRSQRQEQMFKLVEACHESGLTNKAFCQEQGLALQVFYYWQRRYRKFYFDKGYENTLMPVEFQETQHQHHPALEIHYPNGVKVVLKDTPSSAQVANLINLV
jgi:hypothetical protein